MFKFFGLGAYRLFLRLWNRPIHCLGFSNVINSPTGWLSTSSPRMHHSEPLCKRGLEAVFPSWDFGPPFLLSYFLQPCQFPLYVQNWATSCTSTYSCTVPWAPMPGWPCAQSVSTFTRRNSDMHKQDF